MPNRNGSDVVQCAGRRCRISFLLHIGIDGDASRVASFFAVLRTDSVELYRMTAAYEPSASDKASVLEDHLLLSLEITGLHAFSLEPHMSCLDKGRYGQIIIIVRKRSRITSGAPRLKK